MNDARKNENDYYRKKYKKTKIVCTLGPSSSSKAVIKKLIDSGMDVARLNFSHGNEIFFDGLIGLIRELSNDTAILIDLPGPKIRTGKQKENEIILKKGGHINVVNRKELSDNKNISIDYKFLTQDVKKNDLIFIDDGKIQLQVTDIAPDKNGLLCKILRDGILRAEKGVNFPNIKLSVPSVTKNDFKYLKFGAEHNADMFAVSFVRHPEDIITVKNFLKKNYPEKHFFIIAKIEKSEAVENIEAIAMVSDGIMVARGDLGVETPIESIALKQKRIISVANIYKRPVITATQMLESMVINESPTRAEVTDIANAILDGTDAVMLSEETAIGNNPALAVIYMNKIIKTTENSNIFIENNYRNIGIRRINGKGGGGREYVGNYRINPDEEYDISNEYNNNISNIVAKMAVLASYSVDGSFIAAVTRSGYTAGLISSLRPLVPIISIVPDERIKRQLSLNFGVVSFVMRDIIKENVDIKNIIDFINKSEKMKYFKENFKYAVLSGGIPLGEPGSTDFVRIIKL